MSEVIQRDEGAANSMFTVLQRAASDPAVDPDKIERLYEIMDRERKTEAQRAFNASMVKAQADVMPIKRDQWNDQTSSWFADLGKVADMVNDVFTKHGFSLRFSEAESSCPQICRIQCKLGHELGHTETEWCDVPVSVEGIKGTRMMTDTHGKGSAFTYGRRYLTLMLANLPTEKDTDGNAAQQSRSISNQQTFSGPGAELLQGAQNQDELLKAWRSLSAKERGDLSALFGQRKKELR